MKTLAKKFEELNKKYVNLDKEANTANELRQNQISLKLESIQEEMSKISSQMEASESKNKVSVKKATTKTVENPTKEEISEINKKLDKGISFSNNYFQFVKRKDGAMLRYDLKKGTYKFFDTIDSFSKAIVRFTKRGW